MTSFHLGELTIEATESPDAVTAKFLVGDTFRTDRNIHMIKVGFNYLFNGPISSRYY